MLDSLIHRGPDGEGAHQEPGVALGSRRLAIVDPHHGEQPFSNEDGRIWAAFNGELFEYPDLRERLLGWSHTLKTRCDSELWPHLYEQFGLQMFGSAKGQFAVALWDRTERRVVLGRDRFGICPLYYAQRDGWLLWASEIRALFASSLVEPVPDVRGISFFCSFYAGPSSRTCFEGVHLLPPGHRLEIVDGQVKMSRYWDLDFPKMGEERRGNGLVDELDAKLVQAVRRRLLGDVPVGSYLSGGIDSSLVLGMAARLAQEPVQAFSIGLDRGTGIDESVLASETARHLGSPLAIARMNNADIARAYPELIESAEMPVLDTSCACLMRLASVVHDHGFKVVLTGEGADEAFAGYAWYKADKFAGMLPRSLQRALRQGVLFGAGAPDSGLQGAEPRCAQDLIFQALAATIGQLYSPEMRERLKGYAPWDDMPIDWDRVRTWHPLNQSLYIGYKTMLAGMLLFAKGDRVAMHSSVETRYPFLDEDVVEWAASIGPEYKLRGMTEKWILRQVAGRYLPAQNARRSKTMFRAKLSRTFLGPERPHWVDQLLSPESLRISGWFDPTAVANARIRLGEFRTAALDPGVTCVIAAQLWHHVWCGGKLCDLPALSFATPAAELAGP